MRLLWSAAFLAFVGRGALCFFDGDEFQRYDGWMNNLNRRNAGAVQSPLMYLAPPAYADGVYKASGGRPDAGRVSAELFAGPDGLTNPANATRHNLLFVTFGQVISGEVMATSSSGQTACPAEKMKVNMILGKYCQRPDGNASALSCNASKSMGIPQFRVAYDPSSGRHLNNPRKPTNFRTSWLDASSVYSTTWMVVDSLRAWDGTGMLKSQRNGDPMHNTMAAPLLNPPPPAMHPHIMDTERQFLVGSGKGNQEPGLLAISFVFHRWHNHFAKTLKAQHPTWTDEQLFQRARRWTVATIQHITLYEFLPAFVGESVPAYSGYKPSVDPAISVEFQAAAYRWGHSLVPSGFFVADAACTFTRFPYCNVWWNSQEVMEKYGVEAILRGMLAQESEKGDHVFAAGVRESVFGGLKMSQRDLGALNIQRGRDEGLGDYNSVRKSLGLPRVGAWAELNPGLFARQPALFHRAAALYGHSMDNIDLFVGGLLESTDEGLPGPTFKAIIVDQFVRIRDADRFWYENTANGLFNASELALIQTFRLRYVVEAVTNMSTLELGDELFKLDTEGLTKRCVQPEQVTAANVGSCPSEPQTYDFFSGSELSFTLSFALLAIFPLVVILVGVLIAYLRRRFPSGFGRREKKARPASVSARPTLSRRASRRGTYPALSAWEYNGEPSRRGEKKEGFVSKARVKVELSPGPTLSITRNETSKRVLSFADAAKRLEIRLSNVAEGADFVFHLSQPMTYDLILLFDTDDIRGDFLAYFTAELLAAGKNWRSGFLGRQEILSHAVTLAYREELLQDFFTTAFHQVHRAQEKKRGRMVARNLKFDQDKDLSRVRMVLESRIPDALLGLGRGRRGPTTASPAASERAEEDGGAESPRRMLRRALISIELSKAEFAKAMQLKPESMFVQQMFRLADKDRNGTISYPEFIDVLALFSKGSLESKMRMLFDMYDLDGSGDLDKEEFAIMIRSLLDVTGRAASKVCETDVNAMTDGMLAECGLDSKTKITFTDFFHVITTHQSLIWNKETAQTFGVTKEERKLSTDGRDLDGAATLTLDDGCDEGRPSISCRLRRAADQLTRTVENNWNQIFLVFIYLAISSMLFVYNFSRYQFFNEHKGTRFVVGAGASFSRASAQVISFSMGLILVTVCRNLLGTIRSSSVGYYIPVDSAITAHRWLASSIAIMSVIHIVGHAINFYQISTQPPPVIRCLFPDVWLPPDSLLKFDFWLFQTVPGLTGVLLVLAMSVMFVFASRAARRNIFPAFWKTHRLFPLVYALLFLHGSRGFLQPPQFHLFMSVPLALFVVDWVIRLRRHALSLRIASAEPLPSGVLHLSLKKPRSLSYKSGQWVRIACDALSEAEFHPFTITTAPHEKTLDVFIRSAGPWTKRMYALFSDPSTLAHPPSIPRIIIEGPYGSSHQDWFKFKAVVLVGAGIGVTPCASVIKDLVHKVYAQNSDIATRHVYFVWLSRGQQQFEWLLDILREVEEADSDGLVTVDIFVTQLLKDYDIRTMMLYMCEHQFQRLSGRSLFTGIRGRTHFGRIDLQAYLSGVQRRHAGMSKVGVFSCGPKSVVRGVDAMCTTLNGTGVKPRLIAYHEIF